MKYACWGKKRLLLFVIYTKKTAPISHKGGERNETFNNNDNNDLKFI